MTDLVSREVLRNIVTRNGQSGRIPELLEDELDKLEVYFAQTLKEAIPNKYTLDNTADSIEYNMRRGYNEAIDDLTASLEVESKTFKEDES